MRINIYNNCNGMTTIKNIPFSHKDFAENEDAFLEIYRNELTDVLASAIFAHRHDGSYTNLNSLSELSYKITTFLKAAAKKQHRYERWFSLVNIAEEINHTTHYIINAYINFSRLYDGDTTKAYEYVENLYKSLSHDLTYVLPTYKKGA